MMLIERSTWLRAMPQSPLLAFSQVIPERRSSCIHRSWRKRRQVDSDCFDKRRYHNVCQNSRSPGSVTVSCRSQSKQVLKAPVDTTFTRKLTNITYTNYESHEKSRRGGSKSIFPERTTNRPPRLVKQDGEKPINPVLLRDACKCAQCVDPSDRQRNFSYAEIPVNITSESIDSSSEGTSTFKWKNDVLSFKDHTSSYSQSQLSNIALKYSMVDFEMSKDSQHVWDGAEYQNRVKAISYHNFMNDRKSLKSGLQFLWKYGLLFIDEIPKEESSVRKLAERIGPLRTTFYGPTWDVRSVPQAKNVAYTSKYLGFHMDLLYMQQPPAYQLLHCLENTCEGGESRFADTFKALDTLITEQGHEKIQPLGQQRVRYEYSNDQHYYTDSKPTVSRRPKKLPLRSITGAQNELELREIDNIYWSPPFVGSAMTAQNNKSDEDITSFIQASKGFSDILERKQMIYETKMEAGTCAIFDNLRIVHARNAFDLNSGKRWLKGAYLDRQDFISKYADVALDIHSVEKGG